MHWTTYWHDNGSAGTTTTNCDMYDNSASCTSTTQGSRPASSTPIYHTQVNLLVKMPDGTTVPMQCKRPTNTPGLGDVSGLKVAETVETLVSAQATSR